MHYTHLEGLIAAPFTPMYENGTINLSIIPEYYQLLKLNGVIGAFINGSTGEGPSLTTSEKKMVMAAWADCTKGDPDFKVMSLVGGTSVEDARDLAAYASEMGLYGISITAPYYFKPQDLNMLVQMCIAVAEAAPDIAFYYYHIPVLTGVHFPMLSFLKQIHGKLSNFAGIKYTHEDFMDFQACLDFENGRYDMLWGRDENYLPALAIGVKGVVGSTYNYAAPLYQAIKKAWDDDDIHMARNLQLKSIQMIQLLGKYGGIATGKAYMKVIGLDCGSFRLPVKNMTPDDFILFKKEVEALHLDGYLSILNHQFIS
jgi:N-acetylneuraminate lyase